MQNRIKELRIARNLTLQQVAEAVNTTHQQIMRLEKGERKLSPQWMERLAKALKVHPAELFSDPAADPELARGLMGEAARGMRDGMPLDEGLDKLVEAYNALKVARVKTGRRGDFWNYPTLAPVTEIDVRGGMGGGGEAYAHVTTDDDGNSIAADDIAAVWGLPERYVRGDLGMSPDDLRIINSEGDSMSPTIWPGDRIGINVKDQNPTPPGIFALWDGFGIVIKRIERVMGSDPARLRIISDNDKHQAIELTADEVRIIGRVRWVARRI